MEPNPEYVNVPFESVCMKVNPETNKMETKICKSPEAQAGYNWAPSKPDIGWNLEGLDEI